MSRLLCRARRGAAPAPPVLWAALGVALALWFIQFLSGQLNPILLSMAGARVGNAVTLVVEESVTGYITDQAVAYDGLITLEKDANGRITALTSNMAGINLLRGAVLTDVIAAVENLDSGQLSIPLGNLTGVALLSGRGLVLPVEVVAVAAAAARFRQEFTDAGINQTLHRLMLDLTVEVEVLIPGEQLTRQVTTQVCVAETVIVGAVPDTYLDLSPMGGGSPQNP